jgi:hypothetical protein
MFRTVQFLFFLPLVNTVATTMKQKAYQIPLRAARDSGKRRFMDCPPPPPLNKRCF